MKTPIRPHNGKLDGNVLVVGLVVALILGLALASYLVLAGQQHRSMIRSQTWGASLALTEAGVEEALAFINTFEGTSTELSSWTNKAVADGWAQSGNVFWKSTTVDSAIGGYTVYVTNLLDARNLPTKPAIYSEGSAAWKLHGGAAWDLSALPVIQPYFATAGQQATPTPVVRRVAVETVRTPRFPVPMSAIGKINLKGNNIETDSFDSADPNHSTNGHYPAGDLSKTKDNGTVVTLSTLTNSLSVGNADIKGKIKTGPNGTATIGPNGSVGSKAWVEAGNNGIEPGYSSDDMNIDFPKAALPAGSWSALPAATSQTINGITYNRVITSGSYQAKSLSGKIYIPTNAQVVLYITEDVSMSGGDQIDISGQNASLTVYMEGGSFSTSGNAGVNNLSQNALNFALYGLPSCTSISFGGNASFSGTIYAPQADFSLGGGGSTPYDFVGASVSKTVTMNGHFKFHYDENLWVNGPNRGYIPTSWAEK